MYFINIFYVDMCSQDVSKAELPLASKLYLVRSETERIICDDCNVFMYADTVAVHKKTCNILFK